MTRVVVVDDQEMVRAGFKLILEAHGIDVVGEAENGRAGVELAQRLKPDVVLMDVRMPVMDGLEATALLAGPNVAARIAVLILTTFDLDEYVYRALRAGASGFLLKDAPAAELAAAVETVASGHALIAPSVTRRLIAEFAKRPGRDHPAWKELGTLTDREVDVLRLLAKGLSNAEVGERLFVGEATVKTHVSHVLSKLNLRDRVQAVVLAYEAGLVEPGDEASA
jgi:DNA-binding NarL/FixJ family response regulator